MKFVSRLKPCKPSIHDGETSVNSKLAITPSMMQDLTAQGRAVSISSLEHCSYSNNEHTTADMSPEYIRGMDICSLWEQSQISGKRVKNGIKNLNQTLQDYATE